jgi:hypothetical protein
MHVTHLFPAQKFLKWRLRETAVAAGMIASLKRALHIGYLVPIHAGFFSFTKSFVT